MPLPADYKALVFLGAIAVLGAGVRVSRAATHDSSIAGGSLASAGAALDRQMQAADSSAKAGRSAKAKRAKKPRARTSRGSSVPPSAAPSAESPPRPRPKLDLDIATAAQIDSLPGISPGIAKRIAADRLRRGPFLSLDGLRRVTGAGPALLRRIDSLVTFSGTYAFPNWGDTVIPRRLRRAPAPRPP